MAAKPETTFTASVHRHLPPLSELYREKMANPYRGGTPDYWYSAKRDLWVEWKYIVLPKRDGTLVDVGSELSPLQQLWIDSRRREGRDVWVIAGSKDGGIIFQTGPIPTMPTEMFRRLCSPRHSLALDITQFVQGVR